MPLSQIKRGDKLTKFLFAVQIISCHQLFQKGLKKSMKKLCPPMKIFAAEAVNNKL